MFDLQPTPADLAAAQPLRAAPGTASDSAGNAIDPSAAGAPVNNAAAAAAEGVPGETVGQAQRHAQVIAALRGNIAAAAARHRLTSDHERDNKFDQERRRDAATELDAAIAVPHAAAEQPQDQGLSH